jgi:hypothetical protein
MQNIDTMPIVQNLTPDQMDLCREILAKNPLSAARDILTEPPPRGLGLNISRATVGRIKQRLQLEDALSERQHIQADAADILAPEESTAKIRGATFQMLRDKAFRLTLSEDPEHLQVACRILQQIERCEKSAARNIDLGELRLKTAKRVLRRLDEFETIRSNKTYSEERIVTMFADRLFDPLPNQ